MYLSPAMSLDIWNTTSDPYSHEQLADNFLRIDQHDHSTGKGSQIPTAGIRDYAITSSKIAPGAVGSEQIATNLAISVPTGTILAFAGATIPPNYIICQGQQVSRSTYANLFSVIGVIYGSGDGVSTFNVPNLVDNFLLGAGNVISLGEYVAISLQTSGATNSELLGVNFIIAT
jgi:hypothetical protein